MARRLSGLSSFRCGVACVLAVACSSPAASDPGPTGSGSTGADGTGNPALGNGAGQGNGTGAGTPEPVGTTEGDTVVGIDTGGVVEMTNAGGCGSNLTGTVRDFRADHPDFETTDSLPGKAWGLDRGIVGSLLGADRKPIYAGPPEGTPTTTGPDSFVQWFNDVEGVNISQDLTLELTMDPSGAAVFDTTAFFPIDEQLWRRPDIRVAEPNEPHLDDNLAERNFHFTFELHTTFRYEAGQEFAFRGDDDVWVFVNNTLLIDIGGVHGPLEAILPLDDYATELGMVDGEVYPLDFFFAERHQRGSNFRMTTNLVFIECGEVR